MIAYLVVTSLINVSLGYALAVYVNRARMRAADAVQGPLHVEAPEDLRAEQPTGQLAPTTSAADAEAPVASREDRRTDERNATWLAGDEAPSLTQTTMPVEFAAPTAAAASPAAMASEATMVEKDLLAGIEEFRLQLAKIKGHAEGEPLAEALGVSVSVR